MLYFLRLESVKSRDPLIKFRANKAQFGDIISNVHSLVWIVQIVSSSFDDVTQRYGGGKKGERRVHTGEQKGGNTTVVNYY